MPDPMTPLALLPLGAYLAWLAWTAVRVRAAPGEEGYLLAGRTLTLPAFVATTVSTWYGGILGVAEYGYRHGLSTWLVFGVPYYLYAVLFALFLARRARTARVLTVPDRLRERYGPGVALLGSAVVFVMTAPAAYVLALGVLLEHATGLPLAAAVILGTLASLAYVWRGGFRGVVRTDGVQFLLMYGGFALLLGAAVLRFGGPGWLLPRLPETHLAPTGGLPVLAVAAWYGIASATLVEPALYQRCFAARDPAVARRGLLLSVACWAVFDLLTTATALYARAALPGLDDPGGPGATSAHLALAALVLPPLLQGVLITGLLATVMSTVDSYAFIAAVTFGRDLAWRLRGSRGDPGTWSRWGLVATGVVAVGLALWRESIVGLWHDLGSVGTPMLLFPLALSFGTRPVSARWILASMVAGGLVAGGWVAADHVLGDPPWGIPAIFPGLLAAALLAGVARARGRGGEEPATTAQAQ